MSDMVKKLTHCSNCGKSSFVWIGEGEKQQTQCFNSQEYLMVKKISRILYTDKTPYEKKVALFNFLKDLELGELEESKNKKINLLLLGRVYNELAKENLREYKKLESEL